MKFLLRSRKFWFRTALYSTVVIFVSCSSAYGILYRLSNPEKIQQLAQDALSNQRTFKFDANVERTLFPRPTITLRKVSMSGVNSTASEINVEEMKIGIAWKSIFGKPTIEKWVLKQPYARFELDDNGNWNIQDLLEREQKDNHLSINRIIVENASASISTPGLLHRIENVNFRLLNAAERKPKFESEGRLITRRIEYLDWKSSGELTREGKNQIINNILISADAKINEHPVSIEAQGQGYWKIPEQTLTFHNVQINAQSKEQVASINSTIDNATLTTKELNIPKVQAQLNFNESIDANWQATGGASDIYIRPTIANIGHINISGNRQTDSTHLKFTLNSPLEWYKPTGFSFINMNITSHLENKKGEANPRLQAQLQGQFIRLVNGTWYFSSKGTLDDQATIIAANYQVPSDPKVAKKFFAATQIDTFIITPYLGNSLADKFVYPRFLQKDNLPESEISVDIKTFQLPNLTMEDLHTNIHASRQHIAFTDASAKLYAGEISGGLSIANTIPPTFHLQQNAVNVQIHPLLNDLFGATNLAGSGDASFDLTAKGNTRTELISKTNGSFQLRLHEGAWLGLDIGSIIKNPTNALNIRSDSNKNTPFQHFYLDAQIEDGIYHHRDTELISPDLRINASGSSDLSSGKLNEALMVYPSKGDGKPIPLNLKGETDNLSITFDYQSLTQGLSTPEEKQKAILDTLKQPREWFNRDNPNAPPPPTAYELEQQAEKEAKEKEEKERLTTEKVQKEKVTKEKAAKEKAAKEKAATKKTPTKSAKASSQKESVKKAEPKKSNSKKAESKKEQPKKTDKKQTR